MNPAVILTLISGLGEQILAQEAKIRELESRIAELSETK